MRLSEREFWEGDPAFFSALMDRHVEAIKLRFRTTATLTAFYANAHLPEGSRVTTEDFVPGEQVPQGTPPEIEALRWKRWTEQHSVKAE